MNSKSKSFMSKNSTFNNTRNRDFHLNTEESDYTNLITRLKEIKKTIVLLEKIIFK